MLLLLAGCAALPPPAGQIPAGGLLRVYRVADGIYRAPQPTRDQFRLLVGELGLRSVIKLNSWAEGHDELPAGVDLYQHPWLPGGPVTHGEIAAALDDLELGAHPMLIHCTHGEDRTGLLVALYRVAHGSTPAAAYGEWRAYGRDEALLLLSETFFRETGWRP